MQNKWDKQQYHGRRNRYPFTEVVSFVMGNYGGVEDRSKIRILDLGHGGAHHLLFLAQEGFDYYGIDGATESLDIATERLKDAGYRTDTLSVGTFDALPYEDEFFDCTIDRGSLTCNRKVDIPPLLTELRRVMKPGGKLFSMILNEACSAWKDATALGDNDYENFSGRLKDAGILHFTNGEEAAELFSDFQIEDIEILLRKSEYPPAENTSVTAWSLITCHK